MNRLCHAHTLLSYTPPTLNDGNTQHNKAIDLESSYLFFGMRLYLGEPDLGEPKEANAEDSIVSPMQ